MPDPKSSLDLLDNSSTLAPVLTGNPTSKQVEDPLMSAYKSVAATTPRASLNVQPVSLADVQGELNPRFNTVSYGYNNEDAHAQNQGVLDKAFNGVAKGVGLAATTFAGGIADIVYGIPMAIYHGDITKIWDNPVMKGLQDFNKKVDDEYLPNYYSEQESNAKWYGSDNLFTANFLFDKLIKNAGFAVGAIYSGNVMGSLLGVAGKTAGTMFNSLADYTQAYKSFSGVSKNVARLFSQGKNIEAAEALKGSLSTLPELKSTEKALVDIARTQNSIASASDFTNRSLRAIYSSAGESSFEAIGSSTQFREERIQEYKDKWGVDSVPDEVMKEIDQFATKVGKTSFLSNMAVLSLTEYLQMPHLLGSSYKTSKAAANAFRTTNEVVRDEAGKLVAKSSNIFKKTGKALGYVVDPKEGMQEYLQTAIDKGAQSYWNKGYQGEEVGSWISAFGGSVTDIWGSKEAMEAALLGGLSGGLMQSHSTYKENSAKSANTSSFLSEVGKGSTFSEAFNAKVTGAQRAVNLEKEAKTFAEEGDRLNWMDNKFDQAHNYIAPRVKYGRTDTIQEDIEEKMKQSSTQQGYEELQATGEAPLNLKREDYVQKLTEFKAQVKDTIALHESSYLSYGGRVNDKGERKYSDEAIDKMVYVAAKITDYDKRIPKISSDLMQRGIPVQEALEGKVDEAKEYIQKLNVIDNTKEELTSELDDVIELTKRRKDAIDEYNTISKTPEKFTAAKLKTEETPKTLVKIKTKDGEEDLEVGTEYYLGRVIDHDKNGNEVYRFPKLTILGENEDGTIKIKDSNGVVRDVSKDELAGYKLGKVSDTLNNKKAKFFMDNINTIFEFQLGKGKKPLKGRLRYSPKDKILEFVYKDEKGKVRYIEVTGDQFVPKKGYSRALINAVGKLTAEAQKSLEDFAAEEDARVSAKRSVRLKIIENLFDEVSAKIEGTKKLLQSKYEEFEKVVNELQAHENKIKAGELTSRHNFKSTTNKAIKAANKLSRLQEQLRLEIQELEAEKEELEFNEAYIADMAQNIDELPTDSSDFLEELNEQVLDLQILHEETGKQINAYSKILGNVEKALQSAIDLVLDLLNVFEKTYSKVPTSGGQEWVDFLKSNPNFLKLNPSFKEDLKTVEELVSQVDDLDVKPNERTVAELRGNIEALNESLKETEKELKAKELILKKFEKVVAEHKEEQKKKKAIADNKALKEKYFKQQKANEGNAGTPTDPPEVNVTKTQHFFGKLKDIINGLVSSISPAWADTTVDNNFHRRHQSFLFNSTSTNPKVFNQEEKKGLKAKDRIRVMIVTSKTSQALGFAEDWIDEAYRFDGKNVDTAAIRYVHVIDEGEKVHYVDEHGYPMQEVGNYTEVQKFADRIIKGETMTSAEDLQYYENNKEEIEKNLKDTSRLIDTAKIIYSNAENTLPTFKDGSQKYTNKDKVNEEALIKTWRSIRERLLNSSSNTLHKFNVSRGFPDKAEGRHTNLFGTGLFTEEDLESNVVITVPTKDTKFPEGTPMLDFRGNTIFLNNRNLTREEAENVYNILLQAASTEEAITTDIYNYLRGIVYFSSSIQEGKTQKRNQIFLNRDTDGEAQLVLGELQKSVSFIGMSTEDGDNLVDKKEEIIGVLQLMYHHVNNQALLSLKNNPKEVFNELHVVDGKVEVKKEWKSYQHYLLENREGEAPLTANIEIPQEGEVLIKGKYNIVEFSDYEEAKKVKVEKKEEKKPEEEKPEPKEATVNMEYPMTLQGVNWVFHYTVTKDAQGKGVSAKITKITDEALPTVDRSKEFADQIPNMEAGLLIGFNQQFEEAPAPAPAPTPTAEAVDEFDTFYDEAPDDYEDQGRSTFFNSAPGDKVKEHEEVQRMMPKVKITMVDNLINMIGGGQAWGVARSAMMEIFKDAPFGTKFHEAFEQVFNWVLPKKAQNELYEEFKTRKGTFTTFKGETKQASEATFKEAKEQMAEEFIEYKRNTPSPKKVSKLLQFFKDLINLVKEFLNIKPHTLADVFDKMNRGVYRMSPIRTSLSEEYRERNVQGEAISFVNTVLAGMTADVFKEKWQNDVDLIMDIEEDTKDSSSKLFAGLLERMIDYYENPNNKSGMIAYFRSRGAKTSSLEEKAQFKEQAKATLEAWRRVRNQWTNYTEDMKHFLKIFDVAFEVDDEGNLELNVDATSRDERPQNEYNDDKMSVNAKNSASKVVKLLIATIADSEFVKSTIEESIQNRNVLGRITPIRENVMRMRMLAPYAKLFNYVLHNTANTPGIQNILGKLEDLSMNTGLKQNANVKSLLTRLNYNRDKGFEGMSLPQIKLLLKLENALSKNKPTFVRQELNEEGKTIFKHSNIYDRISQLSESWTNGLKALKYTTIKGDEIQFSKDVMASDPYLFLKNLNIPIAKGDISSDAEKELLKTVEVIKAVVQDYINKPMPTTTKGKNIGIDSRIKTLAKLYVQHVEGESTESQHYNMNVKITSNFVLPNFISHILSDTNVAPTLEEFIALNPQYKDLYMGDSHLLHNVMYKDGKVNKKLSVVVVEGKNIYSENRPTDKMNLGERMLYEFNNNLNGIFYSVMPSDSKTEYGIDTGLYIDESFFQPTTKEKATADYVDKMFKSLLNEVELAKDYESRSHILALNRVIGGRVIGKDLRFFKSILSKPLLEKAYKAIDTKGSLDESDKVAFRKDLLAFIEAQAKENIKELSSWKLIESGHIYGLDNDFMDKVFRKNGRSHRMSNEEMLELFKFREMNYVFNAIEMHKLFFNDPAQYKDELKRTKSFMSGREHTHVDTKQDATGLNEALKNALNKGLTKNDIGWTNFKNYLNTITISKIETVSSVAESIKEVLKNSKKYFEMEIADAQSWAHGSAYREILYKSGGRFTSQQEELHQWLLAYERSDKAKLGKYTYSSKELEAADNALMEKRIPTSDKHILYILKPIVSGTRFENGVAVQYLYKTSTAPLYYYFTKGTPLEAVHDKMSEKGFDLLAMDSANKIGMTSTNTSKMFDASGSISKELDTVTPAKIDYKYFGIQVDTAGQHEDQTQGSQLTKLAIVDLLSAGVPIDFINKNSTLNESLIRDAWSKVVDKESESPVFAAVEEHNRVLIALAIKRAEKAFNKLGIKEDDWGYSFRDKSIVANFILAELERRELPENIREGVSTKYDPATGKREFSTPLEANVNYAKIKQILWSVIEKEISRPHTSGGPKVQMSVAGWGNIREVEINGKKVYVDDTLKYYGKDEAGNTTPCEVLLPYHFGEGLREALGDKVKGMSEKEYYDFLINYLNETEEGRSIITGIGFRIPTQALNSVEYFKIKGFLHPQLGDMIVLPAEITTKAGSDFDVDKLNTYLKNWYIGKDGYPKLVKFKELDSNSEKDLTNLYEKTLKNKRKKWEIDDAANRMLNAVFTENGEEAEYVPTLEEFLKSSKGRSSLELNTIEALQNRYYSALEKLMSLPENYIPLITPNDASQLEDISKNIQEATNNVDEDITAGHLINSNFMAKKRNTMLSSKGSVGISAVSATNLAINQMYDIFATIPDKFMDKNIAVRLPHNKVNGRISLSGIYNQVRDVISNINSQITDGTVDVAKKEWLPRMGFTDDMISTALLMNKWGTPIEHVAYFLNQPIIQQYLKELQIQRVSKLYNRELESRTNSQVQKDVSSFYHNSSSFALKSTKPSEYKLEGLKETIKKRPIPLVRGQKTDPNPEKLGYMSQKEGALQVQMLDDFIAYKAMADDLLSVVQGYNYDTSRLASPEHFYAKQLDEEKAEQSSVSHVSSITANSYVGTVARKAKSLNNALKTLLNTQKNRAGFYMSKFAYDIKAQRSILGADNYAKYMGKAEASMIDYIIQTTATIGTQPLNTFIKTMLSSNTSVAKYIEQLRKDIFLNPSHPLAKNTLLLNFITDIDITLKKASAVKIAEPDFDTFTSDTFTDQFRELLESNVTVELPGLTNSKKLVSQLFQNVVVAQVLQNGSTRKQGSFFHLIPNEVYATYAGPALSNMQANLDFFYEEGLFYRNNAKDNKLVPLMRPDFQDANFEIVYDTTTLDNKKQIFFLDIKDFSTNRFVKMFNRETQEVRLFKRVEYEDLKGRKTPVLVNKASSFDDESTGMKVIFQEVNVLGDGNKAQEYYSDKVTSLYNPPIQELTNSVIVKELELKSFNLVYEGLDENGLPSQNSGGTATKDQYKQTQDKINDCLG